MDYAMDNFYDFNEEFDGTTTGNIFRQPSLTMQQPNDSSVSASGSISSAPSAVSSAGVSFIMRIFLDIFSRFGLFVGSDFDKCSANRSLNSVRNSGEDPTTN